MPQTLIVILLLFFAVLAFGWFYLQRAKARTTVTTAGETPQPSQPSEAPDAPPTADPEA